MEMNSNVEYDNGEKVQKQDYFSQQSSVISTLAACYCMISRGFMCRLVTCFADWSNLSFFHQVHWHFYIAVNFLEMFLLFVIICKRQLTKKMLCQLGLAPRFNTSFTFPTSPLLLPAYSDMFCGEHNTTFTHHTHWQNIGTHKFTGIPTCM